MKNKILKIREKCIEANPEIVKLGFGCKIIEKRTGLNWTGIIMSETGESEEYNKDYKDRFKKGEYYVHYPKPVAIGSWLHEEEMEIIGRPIRLADILLAIHEKDKKNKLNKLIKYPFYYNIMQQITAWKLNGKNFWNLKSDNLENQSVECIEFLYNLLK